jgi:hypothetical protein
MGSSAKNLGWQVSIGRSRSTGPGSLGEADFGFQAIPEPAGPSHSLSGQLLPPSFSMIQPLLSQKVAGEKLKVKDTVHLYFAGTLLDTPPASLLHPLLCS